MRDSNKTKVQLINELREARKRILQFGKNSLQILDTEENNFQFERKSALAAQKKSEERWRSITMNSPDFVMVLDTKGTIEFINYTVPNLNVEETVGHTIFDFMPDAFHKDAKNCLKMVLETGEPGEYPTDYPIEGINHHFETRVAPLFENDTVVGFITTSRDITPRKQAEEAWKQSEARLHLAQSVGKVGIWDLDLQSGHLIWSDETYRILGLKAGECTPSNELFLDMVHPDDQQSLNIAFKAAVNENQPYNIDCRVLQKNGTQLVANTQGKVAFDDNGTAIRMLGTFQDVTERIRAEKLRISGQKQLLSIFESMDEVIYVADPETYELLYTNEAFNRVFGKHIGKKCHAVLQNRDDPCPFCTNDLILGENKGTTHIWEFQNEATGNWFRCIDRAVQWTDGRFVRFEMAVNITDAKTAEEARLTLERQVQHAQKLESLGVLAGGIAHDFNNLLMAILGNADLVLDSLSGSSPIRNNVLEIEKASKRAADLTRQMLAYSGKGRFVVEPINLSELVYEMANLLKVSVSKKSELKYDFAGNLPTFDGDATQLSQIVMNLITNASEANEDKSGVISVTTGSMKCSTKFLCDVDESLGIFRDKPLKEGTYVYFEVSDTGCGMDAITIAKIFDPFFTTKFTGRGLGMSAALGIVRGHFGTIRIQSKIGAGTTIRVMFPANASKQDRPEHAPVNTEPGITTYENKSVLIVDDEEIVRSITGDMLRQIGLTVLTAPDGREALSVFRKHVDTISCVLLDLTMPHMDGEETFAEMRRIKPDIIVILCSGYNEQDATQRFAGRGLAGFLQKPFNLTSLRSKLREVLK